MRVLGIPGDMVRGAGLDEYLEEFTEGGKYDVSDLIDDIEQRKRQCWVVMIDEKVRAVALTQVSGIRMKVCSITHVTGTGLAEWKEAFLSIEDWARSIGCKRIDAIARVGYERIGKAFGLKKTHVFLEKEL